MARRADATEVTVRAARADDAPAMDDGGQPVLVAESDGHAVGWARVIRSDERCSFAGVGEYTIYVTLARRCAFREVGVYERHGRLDGEWKDLLIVERLLAGGADQSSQAASSSSASGST